MATKQIKSLVQFSRGTSVVLANLATPIPDGVVVFSIDDGAFKIGDGITMYTALPILFTYADLVSAQGGLSNLFQEPVVDNNGKIAVVKFDQMTNKVYYGVSDVTLSSLLASVSQLESENLAQDTAIASLMNYALSIDAGINTTPDNNIVTINNRRYSNSGMSLAGMKTQIENLSAFTPGSHLLEPVFYADANKTNEIDKENLLDNNTYYIDIKGFNNAATSVTYSLTAANSNVVITQIEGSLFSFQLNNLTGMTKDNVPFALIVGINNDDGDSPMRKAIGCKAYYRRIIVGVYGGTGIDTFNSITTDSSNNIICVGNTLSEGLGGTTYGDALIIKFDSSLNVILCKRYGGTGDDRFISVTTDSENNIICCGNTSSEGSGSNDALVIKFDTNLNILARKRYGGTVTEEFYKVIIDTNNNIICSGYTQSEGSGGNDALIVKFDTNLNILARKRYGGTGNDVFWDLTVDSSNNIYCCGCTLSEGLGGTTNGDALIVKFDSSLNILARKRYGGTSDEVFNSIILDSDNNIICVGFTKSEGLGGTTYGDALIVKFDSSLNILARKHYGGTGDDIFRGVGVDSNNNIICCGFSTSESFGSNDALIIKFDSSLNVILCKRYGGTGDDILIGVVIDSDNNIICCGRFSSEGSGSNDAVVVKFPDNIPSGTITGSILSNLTLTDITTLTLGNSNLTLADSALTLANSTLTLADSTLTLAASALTYEREVLN